MFKLQFKENPNRSIWLVGEKICLGGDKTNDLVLDGLGIDDFHAQILIASDHLILKSQAGSCYVNELPVDGEYQLAANDELRIGKERLLIIDPKQMQDAQLSPTDRVEPQQQEVSGWSLLAEHDKLKSRDFAINGRCVIGRSKDCEFSIPYKLLSREHAALYLEDGQLMVADLGAANGCYVNGNRVEQASLKAGDKVAFAKLAFTVLGPEEEVEEEAPSLSDEQMNKTMIRPAIDMDVALQRAEEQSRKQGDLSVEIDIAEPAAEPATVSSDGDKSKGRLIVLACVVFAALAAGWWLAPTF
ncbi:FHA domain-containing protein [Oceanicoccus sagamiensis]|uniref:FHA domain-containing protein n=1 Tax=Oceanicoccus sagamiensis TaxID=716816 RepID=A0A1X9NDI6_9GAMM|nr:FHA domain-containing protein [Oceanicoccus sagamiensis]ARN76100.1 hypothetical protein BST96_19560 [Oceanicoccus sagamiensis]